ncbi:MAG: cytochrome c oxidase accessory protein CcoG [Azoarcus sp.]|jgi:cytochrome c oxidase accessory protein FixG|nr:cytochrome c oxidase accessory protein CcoG [Azoarcus sp.]
MDDTISNTSPPAPSPLPVSAAEKKGKGGLYTAHSKIYIRAATGIFTKWRWTLVFLTQIVFYGLPWLTWNDRQAVLLHLVERKFYIFGWVFWPQDVFFLAILLIISAYSLFFFTAIAGRLWCGYACPQTVYTEIFLWIEQKIEGDHLKRAKLDASPMNGRKFSIKAAKCGIWGALALWTGFTFVAYFSPLDELLGSVSTLSFGAWETFWILFYGTFTFVFAGFMREQVCKFMCPYARFQSVMFDPDTLVVTYDEARGEPRGVHRKGGAAASKGDCIDCGICVQVCPTGIDIRNGLQYECIGCAACADACDQIMDKVGAPRGLVRYSTESALKQGWGSSEIFHHILRLRTLIYGAVLLFIGIAFIWGLATRIPLRVDVIRDRASLGQEIPGGMIENIYTLRVMNMTEQPRVFTVSVEGLREVQISSEHRVEVGAAQTHEITLRVHVPLDTGKQGANEIFFNVSAEDDPGVKRREKATFFFPR